MEAWCEVKDGVAHCQRCNHAFPVIPGGDYLRIADQSTITQHNADEHPEWFLLRIKTEIPEPLQTSYLHYLKERQELKLEKHTKSLTANLRKLMNL